MTLALVLLVLMGTIGAADGLYYHTWKFRLATQPASRKETVTHIIRGLTLAAALLILAQYDPHGAWFWGFVGLFAFDFADDVTDVLLEPDSRKPLGGLPPLEYLVHMTVMGISGAIWTSYTLLGWSNRLAPTALVAAHRPLWLAWDARFIAAGAVGLALLDTVMLVRSSRAARTAPA